MPLIQRWDAAFALVLGQVLADEIEIHVVSVACMGYARWFQCKCFLPYKPQAACKVESIKQ